MTIDEAITKYNNNAKHELTLGSLQGCLEFRRLAEWLKELKAHREAWSKLKNDVVAYHNNYDYDTAIHFLNIIDTRLNEIGSDKE